MLTAPRLLPSSDAAASAPPPRPVATPTPPPPRAAAARTPPARPAGAADYAVRRLEHTVWNRPATVSIYRAMLAVGRWLARWGISADAITALSVILAGASGVSAARGLFAPAAGFLLASGLCDALDGAVARASGRSSRFGALLDSTVDRLADGLPLLGIAAFYAGSPLALVPATAMMGGFLVSYVRARCEALGGELPPLFMRRAERVLLLVATLLLAPVHPGAGELRAPLLLLGIAVTGILSYAAAVLALVRARVALEGPRDGSATGPSE